MEGGDGGEKGEEEEKVYLDCAQIHGVLDDIKIIWYIQSNRIHRLSEGPPMLVS